MLAAVLKDFNQLVLEDLPGKAIKGIRSFPATTWTYLGPGPYLPARAGARSGRGAGTHQVVRHLCHRLQRV